MPYSNKFNGIFILFLLIISSQAFTIDNAAETNTQNSNLTINATVAFLWNVTFNFYVGYYPVIIDLNSDGISEVLVTSQDGYLYCLDNLGNTLWNKRVGSNSRCSPTVVDIDKDGKLEILVTSTDKLYCFSHAGLELWHTDIGYNEYDSPTIADLDQDGYLEILVKSNNEIYCINWDGTNKWDYTNSANIATVIVVADLDSDGTFEILYGSASKIVCLNHNGIKEWEYTSIGWISTNLAVGDLDEDGTKEVIVGSYDNNLHCINHVGIVEWKYTTFSGICSDPIIADLNNDGFVEIIYGTPDSSGSSSVYCLNRLGEFEWKFEKTFNINEDLLVANIDGGQDLEILVQYNNNHLYLLDSSGTEQFSHDFGGEIHFMSSGFVNADNVADLIISRKYVEASTTYYEINCFTFTEISQSGPQQWYCCRGSLFHTGQIDSDGDFIDDMTEEFFNGNPNLPDTDADDLPDGWEVFHGTDLTNADTDSDGLTDGEEVRTIFTDPLNSDTDSDTLLDGEEVLGMYHPLNPGANATGYVHTNPLLADSDGDTYSDAIELAANTSPNDPNDYPINGSPGVIPVWLWWTIGGVLTVGLIVIIIVFIAVSKKKRKPKFEGNIKPLEEEKDKKILSNEEKQAEEERLNALIGFEEQKILSEEPLDLPVSKSEISVKFLTDLLKAKSLIIMENNGIPLLSINFTKDIDPTLTSGFLTAITSFSQEVMLEDQPSKSKFSQMGQEGGIYWIFEGSKVKLALLLESEPSKEFKRPVWQFLNQFETNYQKELKEFTGELHVFESARTLIEEYLLIYYLYPMKLNRQKLNEISLQDNNVAKVLDSYLENFDGKATLDIHQLIDRSFKELRTSGFDEILQQIIFYVENNVLLPIPIALTDL